MICRFDKIALVTPPVVEMLPEAGRVTRHACELGWLFFYLTPTVQDLNWKTVLTGPVNEDRVHDEFEHEKPKNTNDGFSPPNA